MWNKHSNQLSNPRGYRSYVVVYFNINVGDVEESAAMVL
jgi:hypothetical protein